MHPLLSRGRQRHPSMKLSTITLFIGMTFAMSMLDAAQAHRFKSRSLQAMNQEEMAYMQPGGETNYCHRAVEQGGDIEESDVAKMAHWIAKQLKIAMN